MLDAGRLAVVEDLMTRPSIPIPIPTTAASQRIAGFPCLLVGYTFRETTQQAGSVASNTDVEVSADSGNVANAAATATLAGVAGQTTFLAGFEVTGLGATAAGFSTVTVTGLLGGTRTYEIAVPAGVTTPITPLIVEFTRPIPANAVNTSIVVSATAFGAGNTNAEASAHGFQRLAAAAVSPSTASLALLNGLDTGGYLVANADLSAGGTAQLNMGRDGPFCNNGLFLQMLSGSVQGSVWVKA